MTSKLPIPDDVSSSQSIGPMKPIGEDQKLPMSAGSFQSYMQQPANPLLKSNSPTLQSPFEIARGQNTLVSGPNVDTLLSQVNAARGTTQSLQDLLNTRNLKLKKSSKYLLKNKLSDANTHLQTANAKLGAETSPLTAAQAGSGPVGKFLGYVTDGQNQLDSAKRQLQQLKDKGDQLNPADFLLIQIKLNKAQQELEYSSVLLSKAVDDMKTLFNVQI